MRNKKLVLIAFGTAMMVAGLPVQAQSGDVEADALLACRSLSDPVAKLACFENATAGLSAQPAPKATVPSINRSAAIEAAEARAVAAEERARVAEMKAAEAQRIAASASQSESANKDKAPLWARIVPFTGDDADAEPQSFDLSVVRIKRNKVGRHFFYSANGQVWEQIKPGKIKAPQALPAEARIERSMTGAKRFKFKAFDNRPMNVRRFE